MRKNKFIRSLFTMNGCKYRYLENILKEIPKDVKIFLDLFTGTTTISLNIKKVENNINTVYMNEFNPLMFEFINEIYNINENDFIDRVKAIINKYDLENENIKENYFKMRENFNSNKEDILTLFLFSKLSFNSNLRFNKENKFNNPYGNLKYSINNDNLAKIREFFKEIKGNKVEYKLKNYNLLHNLNDIIELSNNVDLIYLDPPYILTNAPYNTFWNDDCEIKLYKLLEYLIKNNKKFIYSNVLKRNDDINIRLSNFIEIYKDILEVKFINTNYKTANKNKKQKTKDVEVLIKNFS